MSLLKLVDEPQEADVDYALSLLRRINSLKFSGREAEDYFHRDGYFYWAFLQFFLFSQCKIYSQFRNYQKFIDAKKANYGWFSQVIIFGVHALFILATGLEILRMCIKRPRVITFTSDFLDSQVPLNPRLRNVHQYFHEHHVPYTEVLHVTTLKNFLTNSLRRRRPAIYYEALEFLARSYKMPAACEVEERSVAGLTLDEFDGDEKPFARHLIKEAIKRVYVYQRLIKMLRFILRVSKVECYMSVDDPRYLYEFLAAAKEENIPTHVFQHANYDYLTGSFTLPKEQYLFPDHYYTWNRYWQRRIVDISDFFALHSGKIQIGGCTFANKMAKPDIRSGNDFTGPNIKVLVPFEVSLRADQIRGYMSSFLEDERIEVLFVLRGTVAHITRQMQIDKYFMPELRNHPRLRVMEPEQRREALSLCDVVAGVYSGFLDESIELGIPIAVLKTGYINVNRLDLDNLASLVDLKDGSTYEQLFRAASADYALLKERCRRVGEGEMDINNTLATILTKR